VREGVADTYAIAPNTLNGLIAHYGNAQSKIYITTFDTPKALDNHPYYLQVWMEDDVLQEDVKYKMSTGMRPWVGDLATVTGTFSAGRTLAEITEDFANILTNSVFLTYSTVVPDLATPGRLQVTEQFFDQGYFTQYLRVETSTYEEHTPYVPTFDSWGYLPRTLKYMDSGTLEIYVAPWDVEGATGIGLKNLGTQADPFIEVRWAFAFASTYRFGDNAQCKIKLMKGKHGFYEVFVNHPQGATKLTLEGPKINATFPTDISSAAPSGAYLQCTGPYNSAEATANANYIKSLYADGAIVHNIGQVQYTLCIVGGGLKAINYVCFDGADRAAANAIMVQSLQYPSESVPMFVGIGKKTSFINWKGVSVNVSGPGSVCKVGNLDIYDQQPVVFANNRGGVGCVSGGQAIFSRVLMTQCGWAATENATSVSAFGTLRFMQHTVIAGSGGAAVSAPAMGTFMTDSGTNAPYNVQLKYNGKGVFVSEGSSAHLFSTQISNTATAIEVSQGGTVYVNGWKGRNAKYQVDIPSGAVTATSGGHVYMPRPGDTSGSINSSVTCSPTYAFYDETTDAWIGPRSGPIPPAPVELPDYSTTYWNQWTGTQLEYDAIAIKDPNTMYVIID
jgi:hypothetical protein